MILNGAYTARSSQLHAVLSRPPVRSLRPVLLLDPDVAGRQARTLLAAQLPDAWHAFVPAHLATAATANRYSAVTLHTMTLKQPDSPVDARAETETEARNGLSVTLLHDELAYDLQLRGLP